MWYFLSFHAGFGSTCNGKAILLFWFVCFACGIFYFFSARYVYSLIVSLTGVKWGWSGNTGRGWGAIKGTGESASSPLSFAHLSVFWSTFVFDAFPLPSLLAALRRL